MFGNIKNYSYLVFNKLTKTKKHAKINTTLFNKRIDENAHRN